MSWLLFIISLPTENATARMRIWRAVKALGCAGLRDGVWLLPARDDTHTGLDTAADDVRKSGGEAWVLAVQADTPLTNNFTALFELPAYPATGGSNDGHGRFIAVAVIFATVRKHGEGNACHTHEQATA